MKKFISLVLISALVLTGCTSPASAPADTVTHGNYTDEMKIEKRVNLQEDGGADYNERGGDHIDSPYFSRLDFYNMQSTDTLTILPKFKTIQQTSEWSCGIDSALMIMEYYGMLGDYTEESLGMLRSNGLEPGPTNLRQAREMFEGVGGFDIVTTVDFEAEGKEFTLDTIKEYLKEGTPIMVCWNDWGGHWQVIIGYDTMGTETTQDDVIIVADPYDTTDHNQDGYGVYGAERFLYNFTFYDFFEEEELNDMCFIVATPKQ